MTGARRGGFTLIELLVVIVIIGILAAVSLNNFTAARDKARISNLHSNIKLVSVGLEQYAADVNGSYPANGMEMDAVTGLLRNDYLPGNKWPPSPWAKISQNVNVPIGGPMLNAATISNGTPLPPLNTRPTSVIGPGLTPTSPAFVVNTYGAIAYDYDNNSGTWVLYGVGKEHGDAMLSSARSRAGSN